MNILFSSSIDHWGGGENWMLSSALGLRDRGHVVGVAARAGSELERRSAEAGLPVWGVRWRGDLDPANTFFFWRLCRRLRTDVLCLNMDKVLRVAGPGARLAGVKAVVPRRGSQFGIGGRISHKLTYLKVATGFIANSGATRDTMIASAPWLPPRKVRLIYNGIHIERCDRPEMRDAVRSELGAGPADPVILMVGELTARKNHIHLIRQLPRLRESFPTLRTWIVGEGPERESLVAEAEALGVGEAVRLLGFRDDVPALMAGSDMLVHPALMEGFGYVLVEAMAAGRPVVAAATSNIPEIIPDGETGYLVDAQDGEALRDRVSRIISDPAHAAALGEAGRRRARELYSFERMLDELEAYFGELCAD